MDAVSPTRAPGQPTSGTRAVLIGLFAVAAAQMWWYYPQLPDVIASNFGGSGEPDGWQSKRTFFLIWGGTLLMLAGSFLGLPPFLSRLPTSLINLPNREYWLAPERRDAALGHLRDEIDRFGVATVGLIVWVGQAVMASNAAGAPHLPSTFLWVMVAYLAYTVWWTVAIVRHYRIPQP